jgi:type IX secretion system PorP/SprF family membrane protein
LNTNPALTGIFNGDVRFGLHFKQQWKSVPVDYLTFSGFADKKFYSKNNDKGFFGAGILFNYDRAGDSRLTQIQGALSGSYTYLLNDHNLITLGVQLGASNMAADFNTDLAWGNQFNGLIYDRTIVSGEPTGKNSITYFDLGGGLNYRWQKTERTKIDLGVGLYNLVSPNQALYADDISDLPLRYTGNLSASFQLSNLLDIQVHGLAQFQDEYREYVPAFNFRLHINQKRGRMFALDIGGIGRLNQDEFDSWTPYLGFDFNHWFLGINYDVNASNFEIATDRQGGPEIFFRYIITNVKPLKTFKNCPIF